MIQDHYNKTVAVQRLDDDSGNTELYSIHLASVRCVMQPLDDAYSQDLEGSFGKESYMFCDICDILEGDLVVDGANKYRVVGVKTHEFLNRPRHMELRIRLPQK
jgi:hypothetical protein